MLLLEALVDPDVEEAREVEPDTDVEETRDVELVLDADVLLLELLAGADVVEVLLLELPAGAEEVTDTTTVDVLLDADDELEAGTVDLMVLVTVEDTLAVDVAVTVTASIRNTSSEIALSLSSSAWNAGRSSPV